MKADSNEGLIISDEAYAQLFTSERTQSVKRRQQQQHALWSKTKEVFSHVGKAPKKLTTKIKEKMNEERRVKSLDVRHTFGKELFST